MADELPAWAREDEQTTLPDWAKEPKSTTALDYPEIYKEMNRESRSQMARGVEQLTAPTGGDLAESAKAAVYGVGNVGLGAAGYALSPISAALRTFIGNPLQERAGIPREYSEFAAGLAIPGIGLKGIAGKTPPRASPARPATPGLSEQAAAEEFLPSGLTKGQATGDLEAIRAENLAARGAQGKEAQDLAAARFEQQTGEAQQAGRDIGERVSRGQGAVTSPADAGAFVKGEVEDTAGRARGIVGRAEEGVAAETQALENQIAAERQRLEGSIQGGRPAIEAPREAGEQVAERVRDQARAGREEYGRLYDVARDVPGEFRPNAFYGLGDRIGLQLASASDPVLIDAINSPRAFRALRVLDDIPNLRLPSPGNTGETLTTGAPMDLRGVDLGRKQLTTMYRDARSAGQNGATDARAIERIIHEYDDTVERLISNGMFSGDPGALDAIRAARAAYSRYAHTFRPQGAGDDVGIAIRRIVDRNATPEEVANMITGSGRIGQQGLPVRIADRMEQILGAHSPEWNSIQQAIFQKATVRNTAGEVDALRTAQGLLDLSGSTLGRRMFTPDQIQGMQGYAQGLRNLEQTMANLPSRQTTQRLGKTYQSAFGGEGIGGQAQRVFQRIVDGSASPEEIAHATFNVINGSTAGNTVRFINAIAGITGETSGSIAAIRQGVWQRLTQNALGKDQPGAQKLAQSINEFLNGNGRSIAQRLYNPDELALMQRYGDTLKRMTIPRFAQTGSDTTPAMLQMLSRLGSTVTSHLLHSVPGVRYAAPFIPFVARRARQAREVARLRQSLAPVTPAPAPIAKPQVLRPMLLPPQTDTK